MNRTDLNTIGKPNLTNFSNIDIGYGVDCAFYKSYFEKYQPPEYKRPSIEIAETPLYGQHITDPVVFSEGNLNQ